MKLEFDTLKKNQTWSLIARIVQRFKAKLVANGMGQVEVQTTLTYLA